MHDVALPGKCERGNLEHQLTGRPGAWPAARRQCAGGYRPPLRDPEAADGPQHLQELYAGAAWSGSQGRLVSADDAYGVTLVGDVEALPGVEMPEEHSRKIIQTMSEGATDYFPP